MTMNYRKCFLGLGIGLSTLCFADPNFYQCVDGKTVYTWLTTGMTGQPSVTYTGPSVLNKDTHGNPAVLNVSAAAGQIVVEKTSLGQLVTITSEQQPGVGVDAKQTVSLTMLAPKIVQDDMGAEYKYDSVLIGIQRLSGVTIRPIGVQDNVVQRINVKCSASTHLFER